MPEKYGFFDLRRYLASRQLWTFRQGGFMSVVREDSMLSIRSFATATTARWSSRPASDRLCAVAGITPQNIQPEHGPRLRQQ